MLKQFYTVTEMIDSAGMRLKHVFGYVDTNGDESESQEDIVTSTHNNMAKFKSWILNLEVWGSYEPLSLECVSISFAKMSALMKL